MDTVSALLAGIALPTRRCSRECLVLTRLVCSWRAMASGMYRDVLLDTPISTLDEKTRGGQARVVVASRLDKDKHGLLDCVSAVIEALGRDALGIDWVLEVLGGGTMSAEMQAFMRDQVAKAPNVDFDIAGWVDSEEVPERLRNAVISIASGRGAAQSLAVGTPVVAFGSQGVYGLQYAQNLEHGLWGNFGGYPLGDRKVTPIASDVALLLRDVLEYSRVQVEGQKATREYLLQSDIDRTLAQIYESNGGSQERRGVGGILKRWTRQQRMGNK